MLGIALAACNRQQVVQGESYCLKVWK